MVSSINNWAKVDGDSFIVCNRPKWFYEDRTPCPDSELNAGGFYELIDDVPEHDPIYEQPIRNTKDLWELRDNKVYITYTLGPSVVEVREELLKQEYEPKLDLMESRVYLDNYSVTHGDDVFPIDYSEKGIKWLANQISTNRHWLRNNVGKDIDVPADLLATTLNEARRRNELVPAVMEEKRFAMMVLMQEDPITDVADHKDRLEQALNVLPGLE